MSKIHIDFPDAPVHSTETRVRITDLSAAAHLGFDNLVVLLNDAFASFFRAHGMERTPDAPVGAIVADLAVRYHGEAFCGDRLCIDTAVGEAYTKGLELLFRVRIPERDLLVAVAKMGVVFYDYRKREPITVPDVFGPYIAGPDRDG